MMKCNPDSKETTRVACFRIAPVHLLVTSFYPPLNILGQTRVIYFGTDSTYKGSGGSRALDLIRCTPQGIKIGPLRRRRGLVR